MDNFSAALRKLEFEKITDRIKALAFSIPAKAVAQSLTPTTNEVEIQQSLRITSEAKELLIRVGEVPLDGLSDISIALKKTTVENQPLQPKELLEIASVLRASRLMAHFVAKHQSVAPTFSPMIRELLVDKVLEFNIDQAIDENGVVKDSASKELRSIRNGMIAASDELRKRLLSILKRISEKEFLQEEIITTRDGRMVIPVKTEHKRNVPGFIHSSSASGATVFIEPAETLELNNDLRELQIREQREIERVLKELTNQVRLQRDPLEASLKRLVEMDLIFAKARYSIEVQGNAPLLSSGARLQLVQARHPVLIQRHSREEVVPLDFQITDDRRTIIITGPNAGGKSVAMKTVGLLALMAQSGIHIPAAPESELPIFEKVFVDIGDEQSIENDLSTFSSHLMNLETILSEASEKSLVLIDEIGAGTDPVEGTALAAAALEELTKRKSVTIATTHHGFLKVFAHQYEGMANASMEFDQQSLRPTYRFRMGIPGSSYAFELGERLGVSHALLERARQHVATDQLQLERLIVELEAKTQELETRLNEARQERDSYRVLVKEYEERTKQLERETKSIRTEAAKKARSLVEDAQSLIERSIKEIRETNAEKSVIKGVKDNMAASHKELESYQEETEEKESTQFFVGDAVRLRSGSGVGEIVEVRGTEATVLWGSATLRVKLRGITHAKKGEAENSQERYRESYDIAAAHEIDVRGLTGEEAIGKIQMFLDNAIMAGLHRADIIHGKGTGALRKKIGEYLKSLPQVRSYRLGEWNEGGTGVTVVELS